MDITEKSLELFLKYAEDAGNWSGTPLVGYGGNVSSSREAARAERGNLIQLKQAGLITTFVDEERKDLTWLSFTAAGRALAKEHGIEVEEGL